MTTTIVKDDEGRDGLETTCTNAPKWLDDPGSDRKADLHVIDYDYAIFTKAASNLEVVLKSLEVYMLEALVAWSQMCSGAETTAAAGRSLEEAYQLDESPFRASTLPVDVPKSKCSNALAANFTDSECMVVTGGFTLSYGPNSTLTQKEVLEEFLKFVKENMNGGAFTVAHTNITGLVYIGEANAGIDGDKSTDISGPSASTRGIDASQDDSDELSGTAKGFIVTGSALLVLAICIVAFKRWMQMRKEGLAKSETKSEEFTVTEDVIDASYSQGSSKEDEDSNMEAQMASVIFVEDHQCVKKDSTELESVANDSHWAVEGKSFSSPSAQSFSDVHSCNSAMCDACSGSPGKTLFVASPPLREEEPIMGSVEIQYSESQNSSAEGAMNTGIIFHPRSGM